MHSLVLGCKSDPTSNLKYLQTIQEKGAKLLGPPHHVRLQYYPLSIRPAVVIGPVPQWTRSQQSWQSHSKRWQKQMMTCQQRHMSKWQQLNDRNQAQKVTFKSKHENHWKYVNKKLALHCSQPKSLTLLPQNRCSKRVVDCTKYKFWVHPNLSPRLRLNLAGLIFNML